MVFMFVAVLGRWEGPTLIELPLRLECNGPVVPFAALPVLSVIDPHGSELSGGLA